MKPTTAQFLKAENVRCQSNANQCIYIGGKEGLWLYHFPTHSGKSSEMLTMEEMEARADAGK